jgi:hypothetical protein
MITSSHDDLVPMAHIVAQTGIPRSTAYRKVREAGERIRQVHRVSPEGRLELHASLSDFLRLVQTKTLQSAQMLGSESGQDLSATELKAAIASLRADIHGLAGQLDVITRYLVDARAQEPARAPAPTQVPGFQTPGLAPGFQVSGGSFGLLSWAREPARLMAVSLRSLLLDDDPHWRQTMALAFAAVALCIVIYTIPTPERGDLFRPDHGPASTFDR